ncbi:MAG: penicillin acylase family protein [Myxococcales bacterium]|nr:penicillin acylase family protein [Myxococcales bacterium]
MRLLLSVTFATAAASMAGVGSVGCGGVDVGPRDGGADAPLDAGVDGGSCEENPLGPGCPTCDDDPSLPWCLDCDEDPSLPDCPFEEPTFRGPSADIEVIRDTLGIPHIYAATDADAMFASGYMQAVDRLFQMDLRRRQALGRQAELFGEGHARQDEILRTMNLRGLARSTAIAMQREDPELFELLVAWTAGVNRRIDEVLSGAAPLPYGFGPEGLGYRPERWSVLDPIAIGKLLLFGNANHLEYEILASILRQYLPEIWDNFSLFIPLEEVYTLPPELRPESPRPGGGRGGAPRDRTSTPRRWPAFSFPPDARRRLGEFLDAMRPLRPWASNNWAVAGRHTVDGRPMLASDPHQPLRSPSLFWAHHMSATGPDGRTQVIGWSFVGTPGVQLGHNDRVAWAATTTYADTMDLWSVQVRRGVARVAGRAIPVLRHEERIEIRGAEPRTLVVERVPGHGVLLPEDLSPLPIGTSGRRMLFRWTGFDRGGVGHEFQTFYGYDIARDVREFAAAAERCETCLFNFVAIDATSMTYRSVPRVPVRMPDSFDRVPYAILDGDDETTFWTRGDLPLERLVRFEGEPRGWIATANNDPFGFIADGEVLGDPWYFGVFFDPGTRARRIEDELQRLVARGRITLEDMQALQTDTHSILADHVLELLERAWERLPTDPDLAPYRDRADLAALRDVLRRWNRRMDRSEPGAVVFEGLLFLLDSRTLGDELSLLFDAVMSASPTTVHKWALLALEGRFENAEMLVPEGPHVVVMRALAETADWLRSRFGGIEPERYRWADLHETCFGADIAGLEVPCVPTDGADGTVDVSEGELFGPDGFREKVQSGAGAIFRAVYRIRDDGTPEVWANFPRGNVGDPRSPHFSDLLEDWVEGRYRRLPFRRDEVEAAAVERLTIARSP